MRRACARALSPRSFLLLEHSLQPTPSPLCGLASWPLLGVILNLTSLELLSAITRRTDIKYTRALTVQHEGPMAACSSLWP